jgi:hypothetical protein
MMTELPPLDSAVLPSASRALRRERQQPAHARAGGPSKLDWTSAEVITALGVRRDKAALSSGCKSHPARAPAGSNRSSYGVAEAFG